MTPAINTAGAEGERSGTARRGALRRAVVRPRSDAEIDAVNPERVLDDLLATLELGELSPTEIRVLLWLAEREATVAELTDALQQRPGALTSVAYRLAMRGLIRRRFESGQRSGFVLAITPAGTLALRPLLQRVTEARAAGGDNPS
jgi:DNA-binding MarR family transcriptional regulator